MIEVEKVALLKDENHYKQILNQLTVLHAQDLGENNTENIFYLGGNYQLKVSKLISKNKAKLALKPKQYGDESSHEFEVHFAFEDAESAEKIVDILIPDKPKVPTTQKRHDFLLSSVELAVKYSDDWGYHVELEQMVDSESAVNQALDTIEGVAVQLGIKTLSKEEAAAHIKHKLAGRGIESKD